MDNVTEYIIQNYIIRKDLNYIEIGEIYRIFTEYDVPRNKVFKLGT